MRFTSAPSGEVGGLRSDDMMMLRRQVDGACGLDSWRQAAVAEAKETSYKVFEYNTYSTHVFLGYEQVMTPRLLSSHLLLPCAPPSARACVCVLQALKKSSVGSITTRAADERVS